MIKVKISTKKILELDRSEFSSTYGNAGHPDAGEIPLQARAGMEEEEIEIHEDSLEEKKDRCYRLAKQKYDVFPSAYASGFIVRCRKGKVAKKRRKQKESIDALEEDESLKKWFSRQGEPGSGSGWVDCNTCRTDPETGRKKCKSCGRKEGEKRSKYPACRPSPSKCTKTGTSAKKSSKRVSWDKKEKD